VRTAPELPQAPQDTRDPAAFALLIRAHARLLRLAERLLGERTAAEDALQDAVLSAWRGYDHFRGDSQPAAWLHAIVVRSCITHHRRSGPTEPLDAIEESSRLWADAAYTVDPADAAIRASEVDTLNAAIAVLPVVYRGALLLHDMEG